MAKKKNRKNKNKAANLRQQFSPVQTPAKPVNKCSPPQKIPDKPCNLQLLRLTEPEGNCSGKKQTRGAEIRKGQSYVRSACPVLLGSGDKFQITANSKANGRPRQVEIEIITQADCSAETHPLAAWGDSEGQGSKVEKKQKLGFYRQSMIGDNTTMGFFAALDAIFNYKPASYSVGATSCGFPKSPGGQSVSNLASVIEVFPGDQYTLELSIPAFLKKDKLIYKKSREDGWTSQRDRDKEAIKKVGDQAEEEIYKPYKEFYKEAGVGKSEFRKFFEDQKKRQIGYVDGDPEGLKVKLSHKDWDRQREADPEDFIKIIRFIRNAEYRFKEINEWIDNLQVGPGVHIKAECQFLVLKMSAKWGYTEYIDDRVFMSFTGSVDIDIIKASVDLSAGFKMAGLADLLLVLKGEGTLGITIPEFTRDSPDDPPKPKVKPRGELELSGGVEGTLMWFAKAEGKVMVTFKAETEELRILSSQGILSGKIVVAREPVEAVVTASCKLYGKTKKFELVKGDPNLAQFDF